MPQGKPMKRIEPYKMARFGILNHIGGIWTPETFDTPEEAQRYISDYERRHKISLSRHTVIPVVLTVRAVQQKTS